MSDILSTDIKFLASERMTQNADGGGRITANVVLDNEENGIFPDIASGDRIAGRTWLVKIFCKIDSPNDALYLASRVFLTEPPLDPKVSLALFTTGSWTDERAALAGYVEAYVTTGPDSEMKLLGDHVAGQQLLFCYQRLGAAIPEVGHVLVLSEETAGVVIAAEFVRVTKVESAETVYVDSQGEYATRRIELTLSDPLSRRYPGGVPSRFSSYVPPTLIRTTSPADAARFKGIAPLTSAVDIGDQTVNITSIYTQIVPATQSETPVIDAQAGGGVTVPVSGGTRSVQFPAVAHTARTQISLNNRQLNYTNLLIPKPQPGTIAVSYRALGKWYTLTDDGTGALSGSYPGVGVGTVNYATGSIAVTLAAIPDINSVILWAWGTPVHFDAPTLSLAAVDFPGWSYQLQHTHLQPRTVTVTWTSAGSLKLATDNGGGKFIGDGSGVIRYVRGQFTLKPALLPDPGSTPNVSYQYGGALVTELFTPTPDGNGFVNITLANAISPGTVKAVWETKRKKTETEQIVTVT